MDWSQLIATHVSLLAGIVLLVLGLWSYFHQRERALYQALAAMLISASVWLFSLALFRGAESPDQRAFWLKTLFFSGSFLPTFFLLFTLAHIGRYPRTLFQAAFFVPVAGLYIIAYVSPHLVHSLGHGGYAVGLAGRALFAVHFALAIAAAFAAMLVELRRDPAFDKGKIVPLTLGAMVSFLAMFVMLYVAGVTGVALGPWLQALVVAVFAAGLASVAWMTDTKGIISDLRPVGGDVFILAILTLAALDLAVSRSQLELGIRMVVLILLAVYGVSGVRGAVRELRRIREIGDLRKEVVRLNGELLRRMAPAYADQLGLYRTMVAPAELLDSAVAVVEDAAANRKIWLTVSAPVGLPQVGCDAAKLHHALVALLNATILRTEHGGVTLAVRSDRGMLEIRVSDSGRGMTQEEVSRVNAALRSGRSQELDAPFALAWAVIRAHDGRVEVSSPGLDHGSTAILAIPLA